MEDDTETGQDQTPESLLPYDEWTETALRHVMVQALHFAAAHGLPGGHHFYLTFRTDHPDTVIPARLKAQYPNEMTIVLQHQFRDLLVDEAAGMMSVALSFNGVSSTLRIPLHAIVAFADPYVRQGMAFRTAPVETPDAADPAPAALPALAVVPETPADAPDEAPDSEPQVVSLDAFRRRTPPKT